MFYYLVMKSCGLKHSANVGVVINENKRKSDSYEQDHIAAALFF
jgi:hypothetical protein